MTRRRRGILLVGLALVLGGLAATDVNRREAELDRRLAPLVDVVVARDDLAAGRPIRTDALLVRRVPQRWAPSGTAATVEEVAGAAPAFALAAGEDVPVTALVAEGEDPGAPVRRGERSVDVVVVGSAKDVRPGARVDVAVIGDGGGNAALQNVEVLRVTPIAEGAADGEERFTAKLRVSAADGLWLVQAQGGGAQVRLLLRSAGDRGTVEATR